MSVVLTAPEEQHEAPSPFLDAQSGRLRDPGIPSGDRNFNWFVRDDFISIPQIAESILFPLYVLALFAYAAKSIIQYYRDGYLNPGKDIVVATTAICWYVGIVALNSDYAFTVTNVIIHGIPYMVLVYWYRTAVTSVRFDDDGSAPPPSG